MRNIAATFGLVTIIVANQSTLAAPPAPSVSTSWSADQLTVTNTWGGKSGSVSVASVIGCTPDSGFIGTTLSKNQSASTNCPDTSVDGGIKITVSATPDNGGADVTATTTTPSKDGGPGPEPGVQCNAGEIGFFGQLAGTRSDYIQFDLSSPDSTAGNTWGGNENFIREVRLYIDKQGAAGVNLIFAGNAINSFNQGWESFNDFRMPINSLVIASVTGSTNYDGNNISLPSSVDGKWLLCGTPDQDPAYDSYATGTGTYAGSVTQSGLLGGVNIMGAEYACSKGFGYHDHTRQGVSHSELVEMLKAWNIKSVRLPMNEHCWIAGLEGEPQQYQEIANNNVAERGQLVTSPENCRIDLYNADTISGLCSTEPSYKVCDGDDAGASNCSTQGEGYRRSFQELIKLLTDASISVVLDLHWTEGADGSTIDNLDQLPRRNRPDNAPRDSTAEIFWHSVAQWPEIAGDPLVYFNLFNEPRIGTGTKVSDWLMWRDGGESGKGRRRGNFVGMQELVDTVRLANTTNPIVVAGVEFGGNGHGLMTYLPYDSTGNIWGDIHSYPGGDYKCWADDGSPDRGRECWNRTLGPLMDNGFGAMIGEAGNSAGGASGCDADVLKYTYDWAAENNVPVLAWTFLASNNPCGVPTTIHQWPGETRWNNGVNADLAEEADTKGLYDDNTNSANNDATLAGCANAAYLAGYWDPVINPNSITPSSWTAADEFGVNCSDYFGLFVPSNPQPVP